MKKTILILFLLFQATLFSQKKVSKMLQTDAVEINISTAGLDNVVLENSTSGFLEVYLYAEDYDDQIIKIENLDKEVNINFEFKGAQTREVVFRKFITKRLQRANAIIKIPQGKKITVFGENVDIQSKSCANDIAIYIDNGIIKLNKVQANLILKLYAGNVYADLHDTTIDVVSNLGEIEVNNVILKKEYQKKEKLSTTSFKINTIKGNIFLRTL
jgi:hypothetical protein